MDRDQVDSGCIDDQHLRGPNDESSDDDISYGIMEEDAIFADHDPMMMSSDDSNSSSGFEAHEALEDSDPDYVDDTAAHSSARVRPRKTTARNNKVRARPSITYATRATRAASRINN